MLGAKAKVEEFCQTVIQDKIDAGGFDFKKPATDIVLFYAGATEEIIAASRKKHPSIPESEHIPNYKAAASDADRLKAMRIDDTHLFDYLMSDEFKKDFAAATGLAGRALKEAIGWVWDDTSDKFSHRGFREAATLVCGASDKSSFVLKELFGMLDGDHLEVLNKRPAALFREFRSLGKDETWRLMCMTYLMALKADAIKFEDGKPQIKDADALKLYRRQRSYFYEWRAGKRADFAAQPKSVKAGFKKARATILSRFNGTSAPGMPANSNVAPMPPLKNAL